MPMIPQAPPGAGQPPLPPELMAMLAGGGGGPPPGMANPAQTGPSGRPPGPRMPPAEQSKLLEEVVKIIDLYRAHQTDPEMLSAVTKITSDLMKLLAMEQKERDGALGVSPQAKFVRRQNGGGGY